MFISIHPFFLKHIYTYICTHTHIYAYRYIYFFSWRMFNPAGLLHGRSGQTVKTKHWVKRGTFEKEPFHVEAAHVSSPPSEGRMKRAPFKG